MGDGAHVPRSTQRNAGSSPDVQKKQRKVNHSGIGNGSIGKTCERASHVARQGNVQNTADRPIPNQNTFAKTSKGRRGGYAPLEQNEF